MNPSRTATRLITLIAATILAFAPLTGCVVVGASSTGGWFIWPGGLGLIFLVLLCLFFFRGRR